MTTFAERQNSAPSDSASGASVLVPFSSALRRTLISLSECLTIVDSAFIFTRFLGADETNQILAAPGIDNAIDCVPNAPQGNPADFAVLFAVVDALQSRIQKD